MENYANLTELIYEPLYPTITTHTFGYGMYGEFKVIIRNDGYINATKLCKLGGKNYFDWSKQVGVKSYVSFLEKNLGPADKHGREPVSYVESSGSNPIDRIVAGTYIHPKLIASLGQWISNEFALLVSNIVDEHLVAEHKARVRALERENGKHLDKIDELMAELKATRHEQNVKFEKLTSIACAQLDELSDARIQLDNVLENNEVLYSHTEELKEQNTQISTKLDDVNTKLDVITTKFDIAVEARVPFIEPDTREFFSLFVLNPPNGKYTHYIMCGKIESRRQNVKKYGEPIFEITSQPNPKELFARLKGTSGIMDCKFSRVRPYHGIEAFIKTITDINDEKYNVVVPTVNPYEGLKMDDLHAICKIRGWRGHSGLNKGPLIEFIKAHGGIQEPINLWAKYDFIFF